jgi:hypothetical protein
MELREYFDKMSETARQYERSGEPDEAQKIRNVRNESWMVGTDVEVRHRQVLAPTRSWR